MKFIHAADIHLDSPLSGLASYKDAPAERLRTATRDAFTNLVDEAIDEAVDFMVIAGDLYDGTWKDYNTGHFFCGQMGRLNAAGIPVFLLYGNHDAESEMTKKLVLPPNVHVFETRKPTTFRIDPLKVALHGRSFKDAATTENLAVGYPEPIDGWFNIGVLHTALEGNAAHALYAPCSLAELAARGYDYWALGHVHEHTILLEAPWVVYPGNLQGRHIRETGPRGAVLVTVDETGKLELERLLVDVLRWHLVEADASSADTLEAVARLVGQEFEVLVAKADERRALSVRVRISGATTVHGELFGREAQMRAEVIAQAAAFGHERLWVEKIRIETRPADAPEVIHGRADGLADLQALLANASRDDALLKELRDELRQLVDKLPVELARSLPEVEAIRAGNMAPILETVSSGLLAQLANAR